MRILMFFHGGSGNRGCEAIVQTAVKVIRARYADAYIALASTKPDSDRHINGLDELIFHNQTRSMALSSLSFWKNYWQVKINKSDVQSYRFLHQDIIQRIADFDVFLSIGGDNYCYGEAPDVYELNRIIKSKGKKLLLWGASIGQDDLSEMKLKDLHTFDHLVIRESESRNALERAGLKNVVLVADGAFLLDVEHLPLPTTWEQGNTIGFNFSPLVDHKIPGSRTAALALLEYILRNTSYTIALTPHVIQPGNDDYECMQSMLTDLGALANERVFLLPNNLTASQYKGYIARMEMFIGARTHATIAAYSRAVPVMVLGYSVKSIGIAKDLFGYSKLVLDKSEISTATNLIEKFKELDAEKHAIKVHLASILPEIQKRSMSAHNYL